MEQIMNSQIKWNNILKHEEQKNEKGEQSSQRAQNRSQTSLNKILVPRETNISTRRNNTIATMEQIMNSQINWNKILIHQEQKLDNKEHKFCERGTKS
jgi:hypothetical protein